MNALFFIFLTFFLIVIQTVVLPSFSWFAYCFDLLIINVLFLSLISNHYSMIFVIIIIGCVMDSISGVPFCYHVFSYLWIYLIVYIAKQLLFQRSLVFLLIISILSIAIQHGLLFFSLFVSPGDIDLNIDLTLLIRQIFLGLALIPPGIWLVNISWRNWILAIKFLQKQIGYNHRG